ncbi:golgin A5 isoform X2 [Arctopsyche grandis]|uniref:golgin A5 isoform X2 n=1 Tax=Arctopsyche grandis TaxID=121162 RepID=UPI00406D7953
MSWLSDLADRAEILLNKIDQNAAAVLQEKDKKALTYTIPVEKGVVTNEEKQFNGYSSASSSIESSTTASFSTLEQNLINNKPKLKVSKKLGLNSPKAKNSSSPLRLKEIVVPEIEHQMENPSINLSQIENIEEVSCSTPENTTVNTDSSILFDEENAMDFEKEMLKNEISVVNNELSLLLTKVKSAEKAQAQFLQMETTYLQVLKENEQLKNMTSSYDNTSQNCDVSVESHNDIIQSLQEDKKSLEEKINELDLQIVSNKSMQREFEIELKSSQEMCQDLSNQLEKARNETSNILSEWKNYKIRASNTLNMKEKIIEQLGSQDNGEASTVDSLDSQLNQIKIDQEVSELRAEHRNKIKEIEQLENRVKLSEKQTSIFREALKQEKSARDIAEKNVNSLNKELKSLHSETAKQISSLRVKFKEHKFGDSEKQTSNLAMNSLNVAESGDERVRSLTQALVAKQAALESVTTDRNALRLQLEKTETKYRSDLVSMRNNQPRIINVNDTDDARFPLLLQESPWDSGLSRRVKKAYSSLDTFSVRVGVFLRRNPVARIFIISYMMILHFWVLIVLCTYTPEVHSKQ